jgi:pimeloyl-ACP methyl ester carboxylesterase
VRLSPDRTRQACTAQEETDVAPELTYEATSRTVQTESWKIHYNEAGEGHPVVMLHGSGPGATGWSNFGPNMPALAERFRVLAVDMPGWGASDAVTFEERDHATAAVSCSTRSASRRPPSSATPWAA